MSDDIEKNGTITFQSGTVIRKKYDVTVSPNGIARLNKVVTIYDNGRVEETIFDYQASHIIIVLTLNKMSPYVAKTGKLSYKSPLDSKLVEKRLLYCNLRDLNSIAVNIPYFYNESNGKNEILQAVETAFLTDKVKDFIEKLLGFHDDFARPLQEMDAITLKVKEIFDAKRAEKHQAQI